MKGRSHRLPPSEPPDDWFDGSWTVDCSCGVTFDDGEEMVSCDECGVWVHTRCSRFTKGEASFACHNCKAAAKRPGASPPFPSADDTEETEVAQLLIELPTKTDPVPGPNRPPFRLADRVHVQGVPGGDPALFQGLSSVFTSDLWRCTGYVPKKFNFQYREFPCWDEEEGENTASRGADVLFSLSKEIVPYVPAMNFKRKVSPDGVRKLDGRKVSGGGGGRSTSAGKKERNKPRTFGASSGNKRKEESGQGKDRSAKKKARSDNDKSPADSKKRCSIPIIVNKSEFREDRDVQVAESDIPDGKRRDRKEEMPAKPTSTDRPEGTDNGDEHKHVIDVKTSVEALFEQGMKQNGPMEMPVKVEQDDLPDPVRTKIPRENDVASDGEGSALPKESVKEEVVNKAVHVPKNENHFERSINRSAYSMTMDLKNSKPGMSDLRNSHHAVQDTHKLPESNDSVLRSSKLDKTEVKIEGGDDQSAGNPNLPFCPVTDGKLHSMDHLPYNCQKSLGQSSENPQDDASVTALPFDELKTQDVKKESEVCYLGCDKLTEATFSSINENKQHGQEVEQSTKSPTTQKVSPELRHGSINVDGTVKAEAQNQSHSLSGVRSLVLGAGTASSTSSVPVILRSSVSGTYKSPSNMISLTSSGKATYLIEKHRVKVGMFTVGKKNSAATTVSSEESMQEVSRQPAKGHPKGSIPSGSKSSQRSRTYVSAAKHTSSDSKEPLVCPSSKVEETTAVLGSGEMNESSETQTASVQIKTMSSNSSQKNEKAHQANHQPSSKVFNSSTPMLPPSSLNAVTTLSDEELALLLHQELNSSPRVPRVPRVRQAAGLQMTPTISMLSKRSSGSGGKDQIFKRKNKEDASRESLRISCEINDETRRMGKVQSSPDWKHQESSFMSDDSNKKDAQNRSSNAVTSAKKYISLASTVATNSGPSSSFEVTGLTSSSMHNSPKDVSADDGTLAPHSLPGLIDEIMSKNRHITYDELCDAVRPV